MLFDHETNDLLVLICQGPRPDPSVACYSELGLLERASWLVNVTPPGPGEIRLRVEATGVSGDRWTVPVTVAAPKVASRVRFM